VQKVRKGARNVAENLKAEAKPTTTSTQIYGKGWGNQTVQPREISILIRGGIQQKIKQQQRL